jgi:hypothetical protein
MNKLTYDISFSTNRIPLNYYFFRMTPIFCLKLMDFASTTSVNDCTRTLYQTARALTINTRGVLPGRIL